MIGPPRWPRVMSSLPFELRSWDEKAGGYREWMMLLIARLQDCKDMPSLLTRSEGEIEANLKMTYSIAEANSQSLSLLLLLLKALLYILRKIFSAETGSSGPERSDR